MKKLHYNRLLAEHAAKLLFDSIEDRQNFVFFYVYDSLQPFTSYNQ